METLQDGACTDRRHCKERNSVWKNEGGEVLQVESEIPNDVSAGGVDFVRLINVTVS